MTRREPRLDAQLSGNSYVPAVLKVGWTEPKPARIQVRTPTHCDHTAYVCVECVDSWENDWKFFFQNTGGGRRLSAERKQA